MLENPNGQKFIVFDTYVGSNHTNLLNLASEFVPGRLKILWQGEAQFVFTHVNVIGDYANEASGL